MRTGDHVYLRAYGDELIQRRVIAMSDRLVYVCRDDEYEVATREGREPISVGFLLSDVVIGDELQKLAVDW